MAAKKKILIVDDIKEITEVISNYLFEKGYECYVASNASDAKQLIRNFSIDIAISDIKMPKESGISLMKWIEENCSSIPVLLMSGQDELLESYKAIKTNSLNILSKPINYEDLNRQLLNLLEQGKKRSLDEEYIPLALRSVIGLNTIHYPVYIRLSESKYIMLAKSGNEMEATLMERLKEKGITELYLQKPDFNKYAETMFKAAVKLSESETVPENTRRSFLLLTGQILTEKIFTNEIDEQILNEAVSYVNIALDYITESKAVYSVLNFINSMDQELYAHQLAVSIYGVMVAKKLNWPSEKLQIIAISGLFHDIGKKNIPLKVLRKHQSELTQEEEHLIRSHPIEGAKLVNDMNQFDPDVVKVILQHHEDCTGQGFPFSLKQEEISDEAKLSYLINTFCKYAIRTPFVEPLTIRESIKQLEMFHSEQIDLQMINGLKALIEKE